MQSTVTSSQRPRSSIPPGFVPLQQFNRPLSSLKHSSLISSNLPQNVNPLAAPASAPSQQQGSSEKLKPASKPKDASIAATAEYLKIYATTAENILKKSIYRMDIEHVLESRPISIGEKENLQLEVYKFVPKVIEEVKNKIFLRYSYIKETSTDCLLQLTYDAKSQIFKAVLYFRYGELINVTVFGYPESFNATVMFKAHNQYQSETLYYRKVTEAVNNVLDKYRSRSAEPLKLFKCVIVFLGPFLKTHQMPCRICRSFIKNDEVPTVFSGLGVGNVSVAHPFCASREGFL
jgi:hypothetical protein